MRRGLPALEGRNRFGWALAAIVLLALVIRCGYVAAAKNGPCTDRVGDLVVAVTQSDCLGGAGFVNDQFWYSVTADQLSHGRFFETAPPAAAPTAAHPPLTVFVLAATSFAFEHLPLSELREKPPAVFGAQLEIHVTRAALHDGAGRGARRAAHRVARAPHRRCAGRAHRAAHCRGVSEPVDSRRPAVPRTDRVRVRARRAAAGIALPRSCLGARALRAR